MPDTHASDTLLRNRAVPRILRLDDILVPDAGLRRAAPSAEADAGLAASLQQLGQLQPIIVRPDPAELGRYIILDGRSRLRAARLAGWQDISAEVVEADDADALAIEAAANMLRVAMHPVDEWRAMVSLQAKGWSLDGAAAALGIKPRQAQRLHKLGSMHADMLAAIEQHGMPPDAQLGVIAAAAHRLGHRRRRERPRRAPGAPRLVPRPPRPVRGRRRAVLLQAVGDWAVASDENGFTGGCNMARNNAVWVGSDGQTAKPSHTGLVEPYAMWRAGKKAAGALLDGREHREVPHG